MGFSIGGKLVGGLCTTASVGVTVAAPCVPKLIDKYVLKSSSSKPESFSSDFSYLEESEVVVSDESLAPQKVEVAEEKSPVIETHTKTSEKVVEPSAPVKKSAEVKKVVSKVAPKELPSEELLDNQKGYDRIKRWIGENSSCNISFVLSAHQNKYLDFTQISRDGIKGVDIFVKFAPINKSKFKAFADELDSQSELSKSYISVLASKCKENPSKKHF